VESVKVSQTTLSLIQGDITKQKTEAIVNAANSSLMGGGGVDGAIHRAGGPAILEDCKKIIAKIGRLPTGEAVITTGGQLPAKFVIHTVGPIWRGGTQNEPELLRNCYINSLRLAKERSIKSISFPSVSTGVYGYPVEKAAEVALKAVLDFLEQNPDTFEEVVFTLFDNRTYQAYAKALASLTAS
jgi:O-acetyl-ADP-ribose deacetylase (regulator of RNase III)